MSSNIRFRIRVLSKNGTWETVGRYISFVQAQRGQNIKAAERKNSLVVLETSEGVRISGLFYY